MLRPHFTKLVGADSMSFRVEENATSPDYPHVTTVTPSVVLSGQAGNNSTDLMQWYPVQVIGLNSGVSSIATSGGHACAIVGGEISCWGSGGVGQLGNGTTANSLIPVPISTPLHEFTSVTLGQTHTCATTGGAILCWGDHAGDNSTDMRVVPTFVYSF